MTKERRNQDFVEAQTAATLAAIGALKNGDADIGQVLASLDALRSITTSKSARVKQLHLADTTSKLQPLTKEHALRPRETKPTKIREISEKNFLAPNAGPLILLALLQRDPAQEGGFAAQKQVGISLQAMLPEARELERSVNPTDRQLFAKLKRQAEQAVNHGKREFAKGLLREAIEYLEEKKDNRTHPLSINVGILARRAMNRIPVNPMWNARLGPEQASWSHVYQHLLAYYRNTSLDDLLAVFYRFGYRGNEGIDHIKSVCEKVLATPDSKRRFVRETKPENANLAVDDYAAVGPLSKSNTLEQLSTIVGGASDLLEIARQSQVIDADQGDLSMPGLAKSFANHRVALIEEFPQALLRDEGTVKIDPSICCPRIANLIFSSGIPGTRTDLPIEFKALRFLILISQTVGPTKHQALVDILFPRIKMTIDPNRPFDWERSS